jgi:hypothetical protein
VSYQSAHIPEARSELVVRSGHSMQDNPRTVAEVRRILLLDLAESCPHGCAPATGENAPLPAIEPARNIRQAQPTIIPRPSRARPLLQGG